MHRLIRTTMAATLLIIPPTAALGQDPTPASSPAADESPSYLFVLSGTSGSMDAETLTLEGVADILAFSDRPERIAMRVPVEEAEVNEMAFEGDPPNAVLSIIGDGMVVNVVLELMSATVDGSTVTLGYELIDGTPPDGAFGPASLYVDDDEGGDSCSALLHISLSGSGGGGVTD